MPIVKKPIKPGVIQGVSDKPSQSPNKELGIVISFPPSAASKVDLTEDDIAEAFAVQHGADFRFDHDAGHWFCWDGSRFASNHTGLAFHYARMLCRKYRNGKTQMASRRAAEGVEHMARRDKRLAVRSSYWDRDPWLLGTPNGTVDLRTGAVKPANREDYITKIVRVPPAPPGTPRPLWKKFMEDATGGDPGVQRLLQQFAGLCLTGINTEQALLFVYGPGGNGKGVYANTLTEIMGDYAQPAPMEMFAACKHSRHLTELAMLRGARLVTASETEKNQAWSQSRINQLTGEDPITANFMRQDHFTFQPQFKLILVGNHKPKLQAVNDAVRRRFIVVPFLFKPTTPDKKLRDKLRDEYPAILRWMIEGCLDWQVNGLQRPDVVLKMTSEYFEEQDLIGRWIAEECERGPDKKESGQPLYESYSEFAKNNGEQPETNTSFGELLGQHGFEKKKTGGKNYYFGIRLKLHPNVNPVGA